MPDLKVVIICASGIVEAELVFLNKLEMAVCGVNQTVSIPTGAVMRILEREQCSGGNFTDYLNGKKL